MIEGALPRLALLDDQLKQMPNADFPAINKVMQVVATQTGKPQFTNFESNRNAIVQEINTALSGSATGSDYRVKIEMENLNAARSPVQISGAISNLREALLARLEPSMSPLYSTEVLRGEKTADQYLKELRQKYTGKYRQQGGPPGAVGQAPKTIPQLSEIGKTTIRALPPGTKRTFGGVEYTREELLGEK